MTIFLKTFQGVPNAGDVAGPYLVNRISGQPIDTVPILDVSDKEHYMTVGSTLRRADQNTIVWGSGLIRPDVAPMAPPKHILGVRGHLTRQRLIDLGLGTYRVIGDPGLLMPAFFRPDVVVSYDFGLIPHYTDEDDPICQDVLERGGLVISPRLPLERYLRQLLQCKCILTSSLHGLVFAHAYGRPAIWMTLSDKVIGAGFKFRDYASYFGERYAGLPKWDPDHSFKDNLSKANCPDMPADLYDSITLFREDLKKRGYL
ncbi:polysaccharide pyruvyl transferase family protein [Primorskyibacter aestuariivivens]|uniref:polysaccharide pyruvyl transferase family protein n=1 Tax=Primorskyibacter aestuariivivens TaxID=1888912 RepID=UPI00230038EC|nr:polysaccharide pyruvyl transferase family protein [Primorskyibacter aestuariivivens]MDA7429597.1 polysaccharide pyruvyl transferase family protein [Primorskyibacter aestuariivivens]